MKRFISNPITPPNSGKKSAKNPNNMEIMMMANKSQNHVFFNFLTGISKIRYIPVMKNNRTNKKEATPNPWYRNKLAR
ncbi:hypothetical protein D9M69_598500 [compost metagenome]